MKKLENGFTLILIYVILEYSIHNYK